MLVLYVVLVVTLFVITKMTVIMMMMFLTLSSNNLTISSLYAIIVIYKNVRFSVKNVKTTKYTAPKIFLSFALIHFNSLGKKKLLINQTCLLNKIHFGMTQLNSIANLNYIPNSIILLYFLSRTPFLFVDFFCLFQYCIHFIYIAFI